MLKRLLGSLDEYLTQFIDDLFKIKEYGPYTCNVFPF